MKIRITLVIPTLGRGGAEWVFSRLAGWLVHQGYEVTVVTYSNIEKEWPLPRTVQRLYINDYIHVGMDDATDALRCLLAKLSSDVIVSFLTRMNLRVLRAAPSPQHVLVCERSYPPARDYTPQEKAAMAELYPTAGALCVQTRRCAETWAYSFMPENIVEVIPNPWIAKTSDPAAAPQGAYIAALGRLTSGKGFEHLLLAFAATISHMPDVRLLFIGDGPLRSTLAEEACALGVDHAVKFYGFCPNPAHVLRQAIFFVLPSLYEGFPNALLEAMHEGVPCIAADCLTGPRELLGEGERGLLYPPGNVKALAQCMCRLYTDAELRAKLGLKAAKYAAAFTEEQIFPQWLSLIQKVGSA